METYMSETNDLLVKRSLPNITGFSDVKANLGALTNRGFELSLNGDVMSRKDFNWSSSVTFSFNRRKIKHLYGDMEDIKDENGNVIGQKEADDYKNKWFIGHDPDQIWDYEGDGVWLSLIHILQGFVISGDGTADRCGVCREERCDGGELFFDVERTHSQHPFIEQSGNLFVFQLVKMIKTFDDLTYRVSEDTRLVVVTVRMD